MRFLSLIACFISFTVFAQPTITSFTPTSGPVGTSVTITGTGFSSTAVNNTVYFGPVKSTVTAASATSLTVTVPPGATYQPISVTRTLLTAYSDRPFIVTFPGGSINANSFAAKVDFTTANAPSSVVTGDFDGDGKADAIVSNYDLGSGNTITVLRNTSTSGTVSFDAPASITVDVPPAGLAAGDFDGDGMLDLALSYGGGSSNHISIFRNISTLGTITFQSKVDFTVGNYGSRIYAHDLDADGKSDLVVERLGAFSIFRNTSTSTINFAAAVNYTEGDHVAIGDLDGDKKPDLALSLYNNPYNLRIYRNTSSGSISFAPKVELTSPGINPGGITLADFSGDGLNDLAVVSTNDNRVSVYKNLSTSGSISFDTKIDYTTGSFPVHDQSADLDGDGKVDFVVLNASSATVSIFRNTSASNAISFAAKFDLAVGPWPTTGRLSDLDNDGKTEIITSNNDGTGISVLRNQMDEAILSSFTPTTAGTGTTVTITGLNLSGATAVSFGGVAASSFTVVSPTSITAVVAAGASGSVSLTTNKGNPSKSGFTYVPPPAISSFIPTTAGPGTTVIITGTNFTGATAVSFGGVSASSYTVNSATTITAVVGTGATGNVSVTTPYGSHSLAGFTFVPAPTVTSFSPVTGAVGSSVVITGTNFSGVIANNTVLFGKVKAIITAATTTSLTVVVPDGASYTPITVTTNNLTAYSNKYFDVTFAGSDGLLTSTSFSQVLNPTGLGFPETVVLGDLDGDGKVDAVVSNSGPNTISIFRNNGSGTFSFESKIDLIGGSSPVGVALGDLNGDGKLDIVAANSNAASVSTFKNNSTSGTISFATKVDFTTATNPQYVAIGDLDQDGKPELVTANFTGSNLISVLRNTSSSSVISFAAKVDLSAGSFPTSVEISDLNADGKQDLVTSNGNASTVSILRNTSVPGALTFAAKVDYPTGTFPIHVAIGDVNEDGFQDVIVANSSSNSISVLKNSGSGTLQAKVDFATASSPNWVALSDINGDGKMDMVSANTNNSVSVLRNSGIGSFATKIDYTVGSSPSNVSVCDMNSDGLPDIVTANNVSAGSLTVLANMLTIVSSFTPTSQETGGTVTITGKNFTGATSVKFGNTAATSFNVVSAATIEAIVGAGTTGDVTVGSPRGTGLLSGFIYTPSPVITSFNPTSAGPGMNVTITGVNFTGTTAVSFGGTVATSYTITSATTISAMVGSGTSGSVSLTTPNGTATRSGFTFVPAPQITSFNPTIAASGATVTISGDNFTGATSVKFGSTAATSFTVVSPTSIEAIVGAGATGSVSVTTPGGTDTLTGFTFTPAPTVTSFTPLIGGPGSNVIITGSNFTGATSVTFGGTAATSFIVLSSTSISAVVGAGSTGSVSVTTPGGIAALIGFTYDPLVTGVEGDESDLSIEIFPNPFDGKKLHLKLPNSTEQPEIVISDLSGKAMIKKHTISRVNDGWTVEYADRITSGSYVLIVQLKSRTIARKLIVVD